jgi:hypothetical protein
MTSAFFGDFLANLLADLVVFALGLLSALWIGRRLDIFERSQQLTDKRFADVIKAHTYLFNLSIEIDSLLIDVPLLLKEFTEHGWGREIRIDTKSWDLLKGSGQLPRLLSMVVLSPLTEFHGHLEYAQRGLERLLDCWLVPQPGTVPGMEAKQKAFFDMTVYGLERAIEVGPKLAEKVDSELESLHEEMKKAVSHLSRRPWWQHILRR